MSHWLFEVTRACNRACGYCYNPDRASPRPEHLGPRHLASLLDLVYAWEEPSGVTLIGGEPLIVDRLEDIVRLFSCRGTPVALSTNGLLLDAERIESLLAAGVRGFEVSLDSIHPQAHRLMTGAGGIERVREAVARLVLAGVPVTVGCVITRSNESTVEDLLDFCYALSVRRVVLAQFVPSGVGRVSNGMALTDTELECVLARIERRVCTLELDVGIGVPVEPCRIDRKQFPHLRFESCRCGVDKWVLEPSGDVRVCELSAECVGNLFDTSMRQIVASEPVERFRAACRGPACVGCPDWAACRGGCRFLHP